MESNGIVITNPEGMVLATLECTHMEDDHARAMQTEVIAAAAKAGTLPVVLDMTKVATVPSLSIGALVTLWKSFQQAGRRFIIVGVQPKVKEVLVICRLDTLFEMADTLVEAQSRLKGA